MNYRMALITDKQRSIGFKLASIADIHPVQNREQALELIKRFFSDGEIGLIIITDNVVPKGPEFDQMRSRSFPTIIPVPTSTYADKEQLGLDLKEFIRKSIGISIEF